MWWNSSQLSSVGDKKTKVWWFPDFCSLLLDLLFISPSARTCSQPAGGAQLAHLRLPELGQTRHRHRRDPHLQVVLHRQKCWRRTGGMWCSLTQHTPSKSSQTKHRHFEFIRAGRRLLTRFLGQFCPGCRFLFCFLIWWLWHSNSFLILYLKSPFNVRLLHTSHRAADSTAK